ncbi:hypothetical protein [Weissella viridescens]|nr:hypothetical protein [Weissella viridescens]
MSERQQCTCGCCDRQPMDTAKANPMMVDVNTVDGETDSVSDIEDTVSPDKPPLRSYLV